ncbi:unnamed protein product [Clavelina lepadiformis]|uniref:Leucine-rich repeat-containing protein 6 n=1 Tax=Clavelina lepadiformis TaxID=159417 RepID=A0ABP0GG22_CLALP
MVRITEELVRKRAEHNECEIFSLEELSLHQQDLGKIEHLDKWCRHLKILYLQNNLIGKIENVGRLKKLEYLNLALNNVERIENLQACESLKKLDLTVNFIGELTSIENLKGNIFLEDLYLTGNPCTQFDGYKEYVVATLPQLRWIDGHEIEKSERIKAMQMLKSIREKIVAQQNEYLEKRALQKEEAKNKPIELEDNDEPSEDEDEETKQKKDQEFWNEKVDYTPETRTSIQNKIQENRDKTHDSKFKQPEIKRERRYFNEEGQPLNVNEAKIDFKLTETEDDSAFVLDVACYKYMDTSLIDADVQPWYVRVTMKGSVLQLVLFEEVKPDSCIAQRSQITGHLIVTMPKLNPPPVPALRPDVERKTKVETETPEKPREILEVREARSFSDNLANIARESPNRIPKSKATPDIKEPENSPDFVDDPDVPPLI